MANRPTDAQRIANQATQLREWSSQLRSEDSTVQQLSLLRRLVADEGNSDATEWLLERVMERALVGDTSAAMAAPTEEEILAELSPLHLEHLLTEAERIQFETDGVRPQPRASSFLLLSRGFLVVQSLHGGFTPAFSLLAVLCGEAGATAAAGLKAARRR